MISLLDHNIGQLMAKIKELGVEKETVLIFTSDNGPHAEGGVNPAHFKSAGPFRGMKRTLYEGGLRVPFRFTNFSEYHCPFLISSTE